MQLLSVKNLKVYEQLPGESAFCKAGSLSGVFCVSAVEIKLTTYDIVIFLMWTGKSNFEQSRSPLKSTVFI